MCCNVLSVRVAGTGVFAAGGCRASCRTAASGQHCSEHSAAEKRSTDSIFEACHFLSLSFFV